MNMLALNLVCVQRLLPAWLLIQRAFIERAIGALCRYVRRFMCLSIYMLLYVV